MATKEVCSISLQEFCTSKIQMSSLTPALLTMVCKNLSFPHLLPLRFLHQTQGNWLISGSGELWAAGEPALEGAYPLWPSASVMEQISHFSLQGGVG